MAKSEEKILAELADLNLKDVRLVNAVITDRIKEALVGLPELTSLSIVITDFDSLSFLSEAKQLKSLTLDYDGLDKGGRTTGISELRQLKSITADDNTLYDLSVLEPLKELEELRFTSRSGGYGDWTLSSKIKDVSPLKHLYNLHTLKLRFGGDKTNLGGFTELKQLKRLSLSLDASPDLTPLEELVQLEELILSSEHNRWGMSPIPSISPLAGMINLTDLTVSNIKLRSIDPVKNMKLLQRLDCSKNHIRTLKPLMKLTELRELNVSGNPVRDYSPIRGLPYYKPSWEMNEK